MARKTVAQTNNSEQPKLDLKRVRQLLVHFADEANANVEAGTLRSFTDPELLDPATWADGEVRGDPKVIAKLLKAKARANGAKQVTQKTRKKATAD